MFEFLGSKFLMVQTFPLILVSVHALPHSHKHSGTDIQLFRVFINLLEATIFLSFFFF